MTRIDSQTKGFDVRPWKWGFAFDKISVTSRQQMAWHGRVSVLLDNLEEPVWGGYGKKWLERNFWHPSRVMRAVIDSGIGGTDRIRLVDSVASFALRAYAGKANDQDVAALKTNVKDAGLHTKFVAQTFDGTTELASRASLSKETAERLGKVLHNDPFFVAVCHGGLVSTIQTGLYYAHNECKDSGLYAVRYSTDKHKDTCPKISSDELDMLSAIAVDHTLVVADEDAFGGDSVRGVVEHLRTNIAGADVIGVVNYDQRYDYTVNRQGEYWENY